MFSLPLTPNTTTPSPPSTTTSTTTTTTVPTPVATAEKTHGIAIDEPSVAHQAILFILDVLIRNNQAMPIVKLYDSFADRTFSPQMLRAVGGNEQGLQQFLLRYPSLFTVANDTVSANSATPVRTLNTNGSSSSKNHHNRPKSTASPASGSEASETNLGGDTIGTPSTNNEPVWDAKTMREIEQEALTFFKKQLSKREEEWLPIVSVAGHASQASPDVRKYVGPQNEFKIFLQRYPHVFIVKDDFCGLKGKADQPGVPFPPPSPPPKRRITLTSNGSIGGGGTSLMLTRSTSFKSGTRPMIGSGINNGSMPSTPTSIGGVGTSSMLLSSSSLSSSTSRGGSNNNNNNGSSTTQQRLTSNEVKAVHYVMRLLHKNGRVLLQNVPGLIARAPDYLAQLIGFTRDDLIAFFKRHNAIFQLHTDGTVSVKTDAVRALLNKNDNTQTTVTTPTTTIVPQQQQQLTSPPFNASAVVLRIFPKYGILNMDNNEQVFFDIQSCQFETFNDLTCVLNPGDYINFTAVLGPKEGSTKWKSLKTWTRGEPRPNQLMTSSNSLSHIVHSASTNNLSSITSSGGYISPPSFEQYPQQQHHQYHHSLNGFAPIDQELNAYQMGSEINGNMDESLDNNGAPSSPLALVNSINSNRHSRLGLPALDEEQAPLPKMAGGLDAEVLRRNLQQVVQRTNAISLREQTDETGRYVSQGCQTTSTGEILATNIHIE